MTWNSISTHFPFWIRKLFRGTRKNDIKKRLCGLLPARFITLWRRVKYVQICSAFNFYKKRFAWRFFKFLILCNARFFPSRYYFNFFFFLKKGVVVALLSLRDDGYLMYQDHKEKIKVGEGQWAPWILSSKVWRRKLNNSYCAHSCFFFVDL